MAVSPMAEAEAVSVVAAAPQYRLRTETPRPTANADRPSTDCQPEAAAPEFADRSAQS
jgi:hypothetical protein